MKTPADQIKDLAKKLKALADQGVGGEKVNAEKKLMGLLSKNGMTLQDLENENVSAELFTFKNGQNKILSHVIWRVNPEFKIWGHKSKKNAFIIDCTHAQKIEILALFDFYSRAYKKEVALFEKAFILKNNLAYSGESNCPAPEPSPEEIKKIVKMMDGIDQQNKFKAQLNA